MERKKRLNKNKIGEDKIQMRNEQNEIYNIDYIKRKKIWQEKG